MADLAHRFAANPLLQPQDVRPSRPEFKVAALLNPGVFQFQGKTGLLIRVAEQPPQEEGWLSTLALNPETDTGFETLRFRQDDPDLKITDKRLFTYQDYLYATTLSHLRLAWSEDGVHFTPDQRPTLVGEGPLELLGIQDPRVTPLDGRFYVAYSAVSWNGLGVKLLSTRDWRTVERHGMIFPPHNKDAALFPEPVDGDYWAFHQPTGVYIGGNYLWVGRSPDLSHWGGHRCLLRTRPGMWDSARVSCGGPPIRTEQGWLEIYHGADDNAHSYLGALLLDLQNPYRVLARSREPIMEPTAPYEREGFFPYAVFTAGHLVEGDTLTLYYAAADETICGAKFSIREILDRLAQASRATGV